MATEKERLLDALLGNEHVTQRNIKFLRGDREDVTEEEFCLQINSALIQKRSKMVAPMGKFPKSEVSIDVKETVKAL